MTDNSLKDNFTRYTVIINCLGEYMNLLAGIAIQTLKSQLYACMEKCLFQLFSYSGLRLILCAYYFLTNKCV
jgi:hypothetical protein